MQRIDADWPAPENIQAFTTSRVGGRSKHAYADANIAMHVGDKREHVSANRAALADLISADAKLHWLEQVHGCDVISPAADAQRPSPSSPRVADGWYSDKVGEALVIMSADCLPLLLCNSAGTEIAALHAGWRGVANNILQHGVRRFKSSPADLLLWIGPGISFDHFTVGTEVREQLLLSTDSALACFSAVAADGSSNVDLAGLVRAQAKALGLAGVYGGEHCSYTDTARFFSYRRESITGRNATVIVRA